ncbi:MAG: M15 family metallopeptidase [Clostridia bacterium]|nr:M15 family metallopeptidase [Clostridia bacterium]
MSLPQTIASLLTAGSLLLTGALDAAAPHNSNTELMLVNRDWRISSEFYPEVRLTNVPGQVRQLQDVSATAMEALFAAAKEEAGVTLISVSGYRTYAKQQTIYSNKLKRVGGSVERADLTVARPGASEHQTGLAMDIGQRSSNSTHLSTAFGKAKGGIWVKENCWRFGFIVRYPDGEEAHQITGYTYEPWHLRYIGLEAAKKMHDSGETILERFLLTERAERLLSLVSDGSASPVAAAPETVVFELPGDMN